MGRLVPEDFKYVKDLGQGSFGKVQHMINDKTSCGYAVKVEPSDAKAPQLFYESRVYMELKNVEHIVKAYLFWRKKGFNYLALELLGPSLEAARKDLSVKDLIEWVAPQAVASLRNLHECNYLHRDIKPDNFLIGCDGIAGRHLFLIDFGLSKKYRVKGTHIPYRRDKHLTGTARYASIYTHLGSEQGRRDDLESLGYTLVYLMKGHLPWQTAFRNTAHNSQKMRSKSKSEQYRAIGDLKLSTPIEVLCEGLPVAMMYYFRYVKQLQFEDAPDYNLLIHYFTSAD